MIPEDDESHPGEGLIFPESIEDRGVGVKTWIGVGRGVGGTPSCINTIYFFGAPSLCINTIYFFWGGTPLCIIIIFFLEDWGGYPSPYQYKY